MASINKVKTNTGEPRYKVRYRSPDGKSREKWFRRKIDAERFANGVEVSKLRGEWIDTREGQVLFGDYLDEWHESRVDLRPNTLATQASLIRNHLRPALGHRQIASIRPSDLRGVVSTMLAQELSPSTIRAVHGLAFSVFESAANDRMIARNPAKGIDLPRVQRTEMRILDHDELRALAGEMADRYSPTVSLAAYCGLRFGEVAGLRISEVNILGQTVNISASLNEVSGDLILGPPKTARSRRRLALPRFVATQLARHIEEYPPGTHGFLFTGPDGGGLRRSNFRKRVWSPAVAATVGRPCTFHDLRHSHAALLIREGLHPKLIQERMGHASIRTTLDTYGHLFPGLDEAAAEALDAAVCGVDVELGRSTAVG